MKNLFKVLGVHRLSSVEEINVARRKKSVDAHPDHGGSAEAMTEINAAHAILTDKQRRKIYIIQLGGAGHACGTCDGKGVNRVKKGFKVTAIHPCDVCDGAGRIL